MTAVKGVISTSVAGYAFGENPKEDMGIFNLVIIEVLTSTFNYMFFYFRIATWLVTLLYCHSYVTSSMVFSSSAVTFQVNLVFKHLQRNNNSAWLTKEADVSSIQHSH